MASPPFTMEAISDYSANHRLKSSILETASLICEMKMKSLLLWQSIAWLPWLRLCVCGQLLALPRTCSRIIVGLISGHMRPQHPGEERDRLGTGKPTISQVFLLPTHPQSPSSMNTTSPMAISQPFLYAWHQEHQPARSFAWAVIMAAISPPFLISLHPAALQHSVIMSPPLPTSQFHKLAQIHSTILLLTFGDSPLPTVLLSSTLRTLAHLFVWCCPWSLFPTLWFPVLLILQNSVHITRSGTETTKLHTACSRLNE